MPYLGWERLWPELRETIAGIFETANDLVIRRLGLRYLNALSHDLHGIASISDLDLEIRVASERVTGNVNLDFTVDVPSNTACTVPIATSEFVQGNLPPNTSVYVDVDVFTKSSFETKERKNRGKLGNDRARQRERTVFPPVKRKTSDFLERMRDSGHPMVLTINGKAELVVQDATSYQKLVDRVDEVEALAGIRRGLADVKAGRVTPLKKFAKEFRTKRGLPSRSH